MSLYKRPDSDVWWANISLPDRSRVRFSTGETDRTAAQRAHDTRKAELWKQPAALKGRTWGKAVEKWIDTKNPSYIELVSLRKFNQYFPDRQLSAITPAAVDAALRKFCRTPATYNRHRARVSGIMALSGLEIDLEPPRKVPAKERMWLTPAQWERLRAELPAHQRVMAEFALATGLRQSNVLNLTWDKVDLGRRLVWVDASEAKARKPIGIPLSQAAHDTLMSVYGQHETYVFTYRGKPIEEIKTAFMAACRRAGVPQFTWHGFRHTWATWHVQNGTPLDVLQKLGAWSSYSMVLRYAHHAPGYLAQFVENSNK